MQCVLLIELYMDVSSTKDILSPVGFIRHLYAAMRMAPGGLAFIGICCSSWVAINSHWAADHSGTVKSCSPEIWMHNHGVVWWCWVRRDIETFEREPSWQWVFWLCIKKNPGNCSGISKSHELLFTACAVYQKSRSISTCHMCSDKWLDNWGIILPFNVPTWCWWGSETQ